MPKPLSIAKITIEKLLVQLAGARRLDKVLGNQLDNVLGALNDERWTAESG